MLKGVSTGKMLSTEVGVPSPFYKDVTFWLQALRSWWRRLKLYSSN